MSCATASMLYWVARTRLLSDFSGTVIDLSYISVHIVWLQPLRKPIDLKLHPSHACKEVSRDYVLMQLGTK